MKATCPTCATAYRVADEKVPDEGAQIKCPKCETLFVVRRSPEAESAETVPPPPVSTLPPRPEPAAPAPHQQATSLQALVGDGAPAEESGLADLAPAQDLAGEPPTVAAISTQARGVSAIRAQSGVRTKAASRDPYRVRTAQGQAHDFPSREAMIKWLKERELVAGCMICEPGGAWTSAEDLMELQMLAPGERAEMGATTGEASALPAPISAPAPRPVPAIGKEEILSADGSQPLVIPAKPVVGQDSSADASAPKTRQGLGPILGLALFLVLILNLLVMAGTLTRYGIVDFSLYLPLEEIGIEFPDLKPDKPMPTLPVKIVAQDPEKNFRQAMVAGRKSLRNRRFSKAALEFNRALSVHPGSVEVLESLAKAYRGLGDLDRARAVWKKARALKGK